LGPSKNKIARPIGILVRIVACVNILLCVLSWFSWYEGSAVTFGFAEEVFGTLRGGGFRADTLWLMVTSFLLFLGLIYYLAIWKRSRTAKVNAVFCVVALGMFCLTVVHLVRSGLLDFS
jgi:hypothetical protein